MHPSTVGRYPAPLSEMCRQSITWAFSTGRLKRFSGWCMKNWSRGPSKPMYMDTDGCSLRPALPACCHRDATEPAACIAPMLTYIHSASKPFCLLCADHSGHQNMPEPGHWVVQACLPGRHHTCSAATSRCDVTGHAWTVGACPTSIVFGTCIAGLRSPGKPRCSVASREPTSTPSSSALVAATAHSLPSNSARSICRRSCQCHAALK
jgi:hypothetical protein